MLPAGYGAGQQAEPGISGVQVLLNPMTLMEIERVTALNAAGQRARR
jgi:hypothetical protein